MCQCKNSDKPYKRSIRLIVVIPVDKVLVDDLHALGREPEVLAVLIGHVVAVHNDRAVGAEPAPRVPRRRAGVDFIKSVPVVIYRCVQLKNIFLSEFLDNKLGSIFLNQCRLNFPIHLKYGV
jgi:hypothetical protein